MVIESWNHGISQGFMGFNYGLADFMGVKNLDLIYIYIYLSKVAGWEIPSLAMEASPSRHIPMISYNYNITTIVT